MALALEAFGFLTVSPNVLRRMHQAISSPAVAVNAASLSQRSLRPRVYSVPLRIDFDPWKQLQEILVENQKLPMQVPY